MLIRHHAVLVLGVHRLQMRREMYVLKRQEVAWYTLRIGFLVGGLEIRCGGCCCGVCAGGGADGGVAERGAEVFEEVGVV